MIAMIYNEYYRDEQRQPKVLVSLGNNDQTGTNGDDLVNDLQNGGKIPKTCRLYDYFTGSKISYSAGEPITLPLGTEAPVYGNGLAFQLYSEQTGAGPIVLQSTNQITANNGSSNNAVTLTNQSNTTVGQGNYLVLPTKEQQPNPNLYTDLTEATAATIRDFKIALMANQVAQNIESGGSRYIEQLFKRWNVYANELELEIPKFMGARTTILNMAMIVGTS
jgi:hypothetical protein